MSLPDRLKTVQFGASKYLCKVAHFQIFLTGGGAARDPSGASSCEARSPCWGGTLGKVGGQEVCLQWEGVSKICHESLWKSVETNSSKQEKAALRESREEKQNGTHGLAWAV